MMAHFNRFPAFLNIFKKEYENIWKKNKYSVICYIYIRATQIWPEVDFSWCSNIALTFGQFFLRNFIDVTPAAPRRFFDSYFHVHFFVGELLNPLYHDKYDKKKNKNCVLRFSPVIIRYLISLPTINDQTMRWVYFLNQMSKHPWKSQLRGQMWAVLIYIIYICRVFEIT